MIALLLAFQTATQTPAPQANAAELVAPGVINTDGDEYGPTLTPDGRTMVFTRRADRRGNENIMVAVLGGTQWTIPDTAPFSGQGQDKEPYFSPDGRRLFFASKRPYDGKDLTRAGEGSYDLFVVERTRDGWGQPRPVTGANSPTYDNYPAAARNGSLYFASHRLSGRNDLMVSRLSNGEYQPAEGLDAINTPATEADPYIAPDESYLIFSSDRAGGAGSGDLYVSFNRNGTWSAPVSLGPAVNSADYEYTPWVQGEWLYFSRGWGEIYRIRLSAIEALRAGGH